MAATSETQPVDRRQARAEADWRPKYNPWLIAVVVAMAAFMEVLDTSIANGALPYMAGSLGAGVDESTWILTSYLVSNAVVLPMGYTAETSGMVLSPGGFVILCLLPFVGRLLSVVPAKQLILFGWCVLAFSLFYSTHIN